MTQDAQSLLPPIIPMEDQTVPSTGGDFRPCHPVMQIPPSL